MNLKEWHASYLYVLNRGSVVGNILPKIQTLMNYSWKMRKCKLNIISVRELFLCSFIKKLQLRNERYNIFKPIREIYCYEIISVIIFADISHSASNPCKLSFQGEVEKIAREAWFESIVDSQIMPLGKDDCCIWILNASIACMRAVSFK